MSVERFMREYWQRRPLLVRQAFPEWQPPVDRSKLFRLASQPDAESRLVVRSGARWAVRHGPFVRRAIPPLKQEGWTLLVQGLDLLDGGARQFLSQFRFVPDTRLDDLMASYATGQGGVGPHADNYDVFLLQAGGRRVWRISRQKNLALQTGKPLRLLAGFRATREWTLEPGDMLYLPPGIPHDGVALGESLTYSVGFRSPTYRELLDPWFAHLVDHSTIRGRYSDAGLAPSSHPAALPASMLAHVFRRLSSVRPTRVDVERFLLENLSEPKPHVVFRRPVRPLGAASFGTALRRRGVVLDIRSRMLTGRGKIGFNGECIDATGTEWRALQTLADARQLSGPAAWLAPASLRRALHAWYLCGWLQLGELNGR